MFAVSLGIMAYNEEANIGRLLQAALEQKLTSCFLKEIIVIISGSTDRTEEIARSFMVSEERIKIFIQPRREGKASAVNLFLSKANGDILILESADTIPSDGTFERLVASFNNKDVGMAGAHPIPVNPKTTFMGFIAHYIWYKHHQVALISPKMGELIAFRNLIHQIPADTAVDEACIEAEIIRKGYKLCYVPDAIVYNKGPETIADLIRQRRRIAAGHKHLLTSQSYKVGTYNPSKVMFFLMLRKTHWLDIKKNIWTVGAISLELICRMLGYYDYYVRKRKYTVWDIATTTKKWN